MPRGGVGAMFAAWGGQRKMRRARAKGAAEQLRVLRRGRNGAKAKRQRRKGKRRGGAHIARGDAIYIHYKIQRKGHSAKRVLFGQNETNSERRMPIE